MTEPPFVSLTNVKVAQFTGSSEFTSEENAERLFEFVVGEFKEHRAVCLGFAGISEVSYKAAERCLGRLGLRFGSRYLSRMLRLSTASLRNEQMKTLVRAQRAGERLYRNGVPE